MQYSLAGSNMMSNICRMTVSESQYYLPEGIKPPVDSIRPGYKVR